MVRAIAVKELRETWSFAVLAVVLYAGLVCNQIGKWNTLLSFFLGWIPGLKPCACPSLFPFLHDSFQTPYTFVAASLAIVLGLRQSAWEPSQGTAHYLLHLPLSRSSIFLSKLLVGIGLLLACTLLPIITYGVWAATPGTHAAPFEWSMARPAFQIWLTMPLIYLGAFLAGIRPARWYGSRLLPLVAVALPAFLLLYVPDWWLLGLPLLLVMAAALTGVILLEASARDY
jgi:ABC-type transport system involved in multi-copper enzyme maturation permease subunit